jgi:hypothetical protein
MPMSDPIPPLDPSSSHPTQPPDPTLGPVPPDPTPAGSDPFPLGAPPPRDAGRSAATNPSADVGRVVAWIVFPLFLAVFLILAVLVVKGF